MAIDSSRTAGPGPGALAGLFAAAVAVRALPAPTVLLVDRVQPFGGDAFYHLRRISYVVAHFPDSLVFDPYLNYPGGAAAIWTPVFDWLIGAVALAFGAEPGSAEMERIAVWMPPILGGATVVALVRMAGRAFGPRVGLTAGVLLCVSSGHFWYSQIGFVDHHVAVGLVTTLLLARAIDYLDVVDANARAWPLGTVVAACLWIWPGTLLHVGIVEVALALSACRMGGADAARRFARVQWIALLWLLPATLSHPWQQWDAFSPVVLSRFQPWLFAVLSLVGVGCVGLWSSTRFGQSALSRATAAVGLAAGLASISAIAVPGLASGAGDAWQWFYKQERFQALVSESLPLLSVDGAFGIEVAVGRLSYFVLLAPFALVWMALSARHSARPGGRMLVVFWVATLLAATLLQRRFFNSASIGLALLMAWSVHRVSDAWPSRGAGARWLPGAVCGALAIGLMLPSLATFRGTLDNWLDRENLSGTPFQLAENVAIGLSEYLRHQTPETAGWLDPHAQPEYAVMSPWPIGHVIGYVGRRPTVTSGFGDDLGPRNFELAERYYTAREPEALEIAERLGVRYVIAQRNPGFLARTLSTDSLLTALFERDGSADARFAALQRHRLVYESAPLGPRRAEFESLYKLYEVVEGAQIVGRAAPGASVQVATQLVSNRNRSIDYIARTVAADDGHFRLRVPYANPVDGQRSSAVVRVAPHYRLRCGASEQALEVTESDVATGAEVDAGILDCG